MIDLYTYNTFNGQQVSIILEELGLKYVVHEIDLAKGEHNSPAFLLINPSARIPAIVDHSVSLDNLFTLTQTSAILIYLAEKYDKFLPKDIISRAKTLEWLTFHTTDITSSLFNAFFLSSLVEVPQIDAAKLLRERAIGFYRFFDHQLGQTTYLAGEEYTIADIAAYPVVSSVVNNSRMNDYQNIHRWFQQLSDRPAVIQGMNVPDKRRA